MVEKAKISEPFVNQNMIIIFISTIMQDSDINKDESVFLDICNHQLMSLFIGYFHSAAISSEVILINGNSAKNWPNSLIPALSIPDA